MKRALVCLLILCLLSGLCACSPSSGETRTQPKGETDLSRLTGAELYAEAHQKMENVTALRYITKILLGDEVVETVETKRIRKGYDGVSYSRRTSEEEVIFVDGSAYLKSSYGKYRAECTNLEFRQYLEEQVVEPIALDPAYLGTVSRDGQTLSYTVTAPAILKWLEQFGLDRVGSVAGVANLNEEAMILKEEWNVSGEKDGNPVTLSVITEAEEYRAAEIVIAKPENEEEYGLIRNIRVPAMICDVFEGLSDFSQLQITSLSSKSLTVGEKTWSLDEETTLYRVTEPAAYYQTLQSLKHTPAGEEFRLTQERLEEGKWKKTVYELTKATLLSSEESEEKSLPSAKEMLKNFPGLSNFSELNLSEGTNDLTATFSLSDVGQEEISSQIATLFAGSGFSPKTYHPVSCEGTVTIDKKTGELLSAALFFQSTATDEAGISAAFSCSYSLTVDETADVSVPELQIPTPTTPGQEVEGGHHPHD